MSLQQMSPDDSAPQLPDKPYAVRFIKQVIQSTVHVSVTQQVFMGSAAAIITLIVQIQQGLVPADSVGIYVRAALWVLGLTYGSIIVLNIIRAPFILDSLQRERIAELQARLIAAERRQLEGSNLTATREDKQVTVTDAERRLFARGKPAQVNAAHVEKETSKPDPIVVCRRVFQTPVHWNGQTFMPEKQPQENSLYAAVAVLVNRPKAKGLVPTLPYLSVQLTFYDTEGEYHGRVGHAFWLGYDYNHYPLSAGGEALLVVAVGSKEHGMIAANNYHAQYSKDDDEMPVEFEGERYRVQAYITNDNVGLETVFFELSRDEKGLPLLKLAEEDAA